MEFYHLLNRGVDKRNIVMDDNDRFRFMHSLFVFNDANYVNPNHGRPGYTLSGADRKLLVHIHAYCLMPNHYHLIVSPINDDIKNISLFMKKINMGYAKYFNERHNRSGYLWQGKYKKIHIERTAHFMYIPYYVHLNPLDLHMPEWRNGAIKDKTKALKFLEKYKWSSHLNYLGYDNFNSIITQHELGPILGSKNDYLSKIEDIISSPKLTLKSSIIE